MLVALVVAAVTVAIVVPGYRAGVLRARRGEAIAALTQIARAEERYFLEHNRYTMRLTDRAPAGLGLTPPGRARYAVSVEVQNTGTAAFTAHAALAAAPDADVRCASFAINQNGIRAARDAAGIDRTDECWGATP
jgi:type IV pilus assembly protein PilE